jgi:hypothetical protein
LSSIGETQRAIKILQEQTVADKTSRAKDPQTIFESSTVEMLLGKLLWHCNEFEQANTAFKSARMLNDMSYKRASRNAALLVWLAKCDKNDKAKSREALHSCEALESNGDNGKYYADAVEALDLCARSLELEAPKTAKGLYEKARELGSHVKDRQALAEAVRDECAYELDKKNWPALVEITNSEKEFIPAAAVKEDASAQLLIGHVVATDLDGRPVECELQFAKAVADFEQNVDLKQVIVEFKNCLSQTVPGSDAEPRINWMLGRSYNKAHQDSKALDYFSKAIKYGANFVRSRQFLEKGIPECAPLMKSHSMSDDLRKLDKLSN